MKTTNRITSLFNIEYPIIQAGMVWVSGWKLASAVSNAGGLGLIGAGSMKPGLLCEHIQKCKAATQKPFGVNIPLLRHDADDLIAVTIEEKIEIVFTSAGHPGRHIEKLKSDNIKVVHVVSNVKQAMKSEEVGCDAVVGEGVEAGGHNGGDEITTFCLIPQLVDAVKIPVIAAGGIADGRQIAAVFCLGAEAVQIGTLFAATVESSAHQTYKRKIVEAKDNDTVLSFRKVALMRMLKNEFALKSVQAEIKGLSKEEMISFLNHKREMKGIFEGDEIEGAMEAGQSSGLVKEILTVQQVFDKLIREYLATKQKWFL
ncbi:MAG: 2-nitropropane dioxygenase [Ignavibacteria bacterium CG1_02_37_35]|nr:MAG: 2-nitropropane dioxygenase [Ignavibacteria bacterium CG1_02_37_35]